MFKFDDKEYRNLQEQVLKNQCDIASMRFGLNILGQVDTELELPKAPKQGDVYLVGTVIPYHVYVYTDGIWRDLGTFASTVPGPKGDMGEKGQPGKDGKDGERGLQGFQGVQGERGPAGIKGDKGDRGETGPLATPVKLIGFVNSYDLLPDAYSVPRNYAYAVGTASPYQIYAIFGNIDLEWKSLGDFTISDNAKDVAYKDTNVEAALDNLDANKINVKPITWSSLPEGTVDKKTFYNKTIATLRTASNKLYMFGTPEEAPIKEFFDIWGKPIDFKATHIYIVIESISNTSSRDSFKMTIHSSNYANMYYMVVSGYAGQLVGNGSGWISFNGISVDKQKELAKNDGYYQKMTVGDSEGLIDPEPQKTINHSFISQITAGDQSIENGVAIIEVIGGNTLVINQIQPILKNDTNTINGITFVKKDGKLTLNGTASAKASISLSEANYIPGHQYMFKGVPSTGTNNGIYIDVWKNEKDYGSGLIKTFSASNLSQNILSVEKDIVCSNLVIEPQIIDLTQMFGVGNEPKTVEEAYKRGVPTDYIAYNEGSILSAVPDRLQSYNANQELIDTLNIDSQTYFPNGMNGIGNVRDTIEKDKATKRFGVVDLGTLNWNKQAGMRWNARFDMAKPFYDNTKRANIICARYENRSLNELGSHTDKTMCGISLTLDTFTIYLEDSELTPSNIKTELNGVMLVYELAEPIVTPISPALDMAYKVENGGLETWYSPVSVYNATLYKKNLVLKLSKVKTRAEQDLTDANQDDRIRQLEDGVTHLLGDTHDLLDFMTAKANTEVEVGITLTKTEIPSKVALNVAEVNKLKGIRAWYDFEYNGNILCAQCDIRFSTKSNARYVIGVPLPLKTQLVSVDIVTQYDKTTGVLAIIRADGQPTSTSTEIIEVKGIE